MIGHFSFAIGLVLAVVAVNSSESDFRQRAFLCRDNGKRRLLGEEDSVNTWFAIWKKHCESGEIMIKISNLQMAVCIPRVSWNTVTQADLEERWARLFNATEVNTTWTCRNMMLGKTIVPHSSSDHSSDNPSPDNQSLGDHSTVEDVNENRLRRRSLEPCLDLILPSDAPSTEKNV